MKKGRFTRTRLIIRTAIYEMLEQTPVPLRWLTDCDHAILEWMNQPGKMSTTKDIVLNVASEDCGERKIRDRIPVLRDRNLLKKPDNIPGDMSERGVYQITELGQKIADGQISLSQLRELEESGAFE